MLATDSPQVEPISGGHAPRHRHRRHGLGLAVEAGAVALSPVVAYFVLRIRGMAPVPLPDPSMHTIYIVDPREMFMRYSAALEPTARLREGAQVGFLVVAHLFYVVFGAVPGFFATRYLFALIAIVPAYCLLRRLYGIPAGALAIIALLSSPVLITAWGTDYPDSAVVSYVAGAVGCLAMPCRGRWRSVCIALAGLLLTMAVWSHGMGMVLAGVTVGVYATVRLLRGRQHLVQDGAVLAGVGVLATLVLMAASALVFGQLDFIRPTFAAASYLDQPSQILLFHSTNWRWAPYLAYLLVPPSVIVMLAVTFARKLRAVPTPQLFVGASVRCPGCRLRLPAVRLPRRVPRDVLLLLDAVGRDLPGFGCCSCRGSVGHCRHAALHAGCLPWQCLPFLSRTRRARTCRPSGGFRPGRFWPSCRLWPATALRIGGRVRPERSLRGMGRGFAVVATVVAVAGSLLVLTGRAESVRTRPLPVWPTRPTRRPRTRLLSVAARAS